MNANDATESNHNHEDDDWTFEIRYEGGYAEAHTIDLEQLGTSLQGFAKVLAVCANFVETGQHTIRSDGLSVKVVAKPAPDHHCFEISTAIVKISENLGLWSGLGTSAIVAVVGYVFNRRKGEEVKFLTESLKLSMHINEALQRSLQINAENQARLFKIIDRLADALQPAARKALEPVGRSVYSVNLRRQGYSTPDCVFDQATKDSLVIQPNVIQDAQIYEGMITELDMLNGSCKVTLMPNLSDGIEARISASIYDPLVKQPDSPYVDAMAHQVPISFAAKAEINVEGKIEKLHIFDHMHKG